MEDVERDVYTEAWLSENKLVLGRFSLHSNPFVRCRVASNRHVGQKTLRRLHVDADPAVRMSVIMNENASTKLVYKMFQDEMQRGAPDERVLVAFAGRRDFDSAIYCRLLTYNLWGVNLALANNPSVTFCIVQKMLEFPEEQMRDGTDRNAVIRTIAAQHPSRRGSSPS